jgi:hypothetical protein
MTMMLRFLVSTLASRKSVNMQRKVLGLSSMCILALGFFPVFDVSYGQDKAANQESAAATQLPPSPPRDPAHQRAADLTWRLAPADQKYSSIDGDNLKRFVAEQSAISRRYRDAGHQFWGRIIGTEADAEDAKWMMDALKEFGVSDIHEQYFELPPQWMPQSWSVVATSGAKTLVLDTAQPVYATPATRPEGLDLEAVFVGSGSEAELKLAPDVRGKAAFIMSQDLISRHSGTSSGAIKRVEDHGAAAIFIIVAIPGTNYKTQFYPVLANVPSFSLGDRDGLAIRDMIGMAAGGPTPHVKIKLDVKMVANLKTSTVWATLPGSSDEKVYVLAHRDGWFEGANDNGAGVATMLGIAKYFSKIPKSQRHRTIVFLGTSGHHNVSVIKGNTYNGGESGAWFAQHPEVFANAALLFNCEHTGAADSYWTLGTPPTIRPTNGIQPLTWYVGGTAKLLDISTKAFDAMGVPTDIDSDPGATGEVGRFYWYAPTVELVGASWPWHSDHETDDTISAAGLAAATRAEAKIIADTDTIPLSELRRSSQ